MEESTLWAVGTVAGLAVLGGSAGSVLILTDAFTPTVFGLTLFAAIFLSCGFAMQLYRRGLDHSTIVGGISGFASVFSFFAVPISLRVAWGVPMDPQGVATLLVVPALVTGASGAAGTLFLASGVKRYREKNGMVHAPLTKERS